MTIPDRIKDRIKELRRVPAKELVPNAKNWRRHSKKQQMAMLATLHEIGYADALLAREDKNGKLVLIDGHLRAGTTPNQQVPVLVLDVTEKEAEKILATADPLAAMADTDATALQVLTSGIEFQVPEFGDFVRTLSGQDALEIPDAPESVRQNVDDLQAIKDQRKNANAQTVSKNDTERYLVIVYPTREAREAALKTLGLPVDERYLAADAIELSVRGKSEVQSDRKLKTADRKHSGAGG
jgi:hypothetical protein